MSALDVEQMIAAHHAANVSTGRAPAAPPAAVHRNCKTCGKGFSAGTSKKGVQHAYCTECFAKKRAPARANT